MSNNPLVSVVLPLYNAENFIEESVNSVLRQTYSHFELIIIDDGSKDHSASVIKKINDPRIRFFSQENMGMAATLNKGMQLANGEFIARQDADDICHPQRLEKQVAFLQKNTSIALVGSWAKIFSNNNDKNKSHRHPTESATLKLFLLFDNPFVHSSVMFRKSLIDQVGNYDIKKSALTQDYDLWSRTARKQEIANIAEFLQDYREVSSGISQTTAAYSAKVAEQSIENINFYLQNLLLAADIANLYHGNYKKVNKNTSVQQIESAFDIITDSVVGQEKNVPESFITLKKKYLELLIKKLKRYQRLGSLLIVSRYLYQKIK